MEKTGLKLTELSDKELIDLALQQNQAAFIVLYTRYSAGVRSHISKYISQAEDREKNSMPTTSISDNLPELNDIAAATHNPEEDIINQQEYDKWLANIEKLKDDYRTVAKMNLIDHFGYKEIAESLDLPINTVKTRIRRAKAQLLKMMDISDELQ